MDETRAPAADDLDTIVDTVLEASRALLAVAARCLTDVAGDVTLIQYRSLLSLCSHGPQSLATLADAVGVSRSTESRLCERLVRKGLILRQTDSHDRRAVRLAPTERGRQLVATVTERRRAEIARLLELTLPDDAWLFAISLQKLAAASGEPPSQDWGAVIDA